MNAKSAKVIWGTVEEKGIIEKRAEALFGSLSEKTLVAGTAFGVAVSIGEGLERMFTLPGWSALGLTGEKDHGEYGGQPIKYLWTWQTQFKVLGPHLGACTSIPFAKDVKEGEVCAAVGQPVELIKEVWDPEKKEWDSFSSYDEEGFYSNSEPFVPMNCVSDNTYPTCGDHLEGEHDEYETIGEYVNVSQLESATGEVGFPAEGLGGYVASGDEKLSGLNESEPSYNFGEHKEATALSNPDVAPLADELEIAYALQSSLPPGLEGGIVPSPIARAWTQVRHQSLAQRRRDVRLPNTMDWKPGQSGISLGAWSTRPSTRARGCRGEAERLYITTPTMMSLW